MLEPVLYIGIAQSFFAALMIATKRPKQLSDKVMAAWLFLIGFEMIFSLGKEYYNQLLAFTFIPFTYGPLMYLYVRFLISGKPHFKWYYWGHFIPFLVFFVLTFIYRQRQVIVLHDFFRQDAYFALRMVYGLSFIISISVYSFLSFILIGRHQKRIRDLYSFTSEKITLNWLKGVSISFSVIYLTMFIAGAFNILGHSESYDPLIFSYAGLTLFAFAFSIYGYKQQEIYDYYNSRPVNQEIEPKYERSGLKETDAQKYMDKLLAYMESEKPYLNGELTIHDLSVKLNISRHHLTQVINERLDKNFYTFINEYRVKEVIHRMKNPAYNNYTLLGIAFDSGFNSKSSFNSIFKSYTGMTPSQYRVKVISS
ncbi:MAG: AraC family transcriptional regulator [Chlorobi bacterium]|nr:AraC family transcriptional regulator [Chlorobiota bacterium]